MPTVAIPYPFASTNRELTIHVVEAQGVDVLLWMIHSSSRYANSGSLNREVSRNSYLDATPIRFDTAVLIRSAASIRFS